MITKPNKVDPIELNFPDHQSGNSLCTYKDSPVVFSHLYGKARTEAAAINELDNSAVVYDLFARKIEEHFKLTSHLVDKEMVWLIAQEMEQKLIELKKTYVTTSEQPSS